MKKKIDTPSMINSIIIEKGEASKTFERIKKERLNENEIKKDEETSFSNEIKNSSGDKIGNAIEKSKENKLTESEIKLWSKFNKTLGSEFYRDKKGTFLMSLSSDCLSEYEALSSGISYKMRKKISRNEIIRKVLEEFIHTQKPKLTNIIEKL